MQDDFLPAKSRKRYDEVDKKFSVTSYNKSDTIDKVMLIRKASEIRLMGSKCIVVWILLLNTILKIDL